MKLISQRTVIVVMGPTAVGKSRWVLDMIQHMGRGSCVINGDSQQVFQGLPLLTAQPCDHRGVPHYLYSVIPGQEKGEFSAEQWSARARQAIDKAFAHGWIPWVVGGTGFYLQTLIDGISPVPRESPAQRLVFQKQWSDTPTSALYQQLQKVDAPWSARIHPHDRQRILRGLHVYAATNRPLSHWHNQSRPSPLPYRVIPVILDEDPRILRNNIRHRLDIMWRNGLMNEVENFLRHGDDFSTLMARNVLGLRTLRDILNGHTSEQQGYEKIFIDTCRYAKRQRTWMRHKIRPWMRLRSPVSFAHVAETLQAWL